MNVSELIEKLKELPQETEVFIPLDEGGFLNVQDACEIKVWKDREFDEEGYHLYEKTPGTLKSLKVESVVCVTPWKL